MPLLGPFPEVTDESPREKKEERNHLASKLVDIISNIERYKGT